MKVALLFTLLLLLIPGVTQVNGETREKQPKEWTVLVYMNGDNSLEGEAVNDLNEMERVGSGEKINVVVQVDRTAGYDDRMGDWTDTRRYYILPDGGDPGLNSLRMDGGLGELNMADPLTLKDFLVWGIENFPAHHYMVVLWDHGTGILRYSRGLRVVEEPVRGVSSDITSGRDMEMVQAAWAMGEALNETGLDRIDIVGFDLCSLGHIETAVQFSPYARFMVASFDEEPAPGWNYTTLLTPLARGGMSAEELSVWAVEAYRQEYQEGREYKSLAATNLSLIATEALPLLNNLAETIYTLNFTQLKTVAEIRDKSHRPWRRDVYRDMGDLLLKMRESGALPSTLREEAASLRGVLKRASLNSYAGEMHPDTALGLGIYFPNNFFDEYYTNHIDMARTFWDEAVKRVLEPFDFRPVRINDSSLSSPGITFEVYSTTPDMIQEVWVKGVKETSQGFFEELEGEGTYRFFLPLERDVKCVTYHFEVMGLRYRFRFPLDKEIKVSFGEDLSPPEGEILGGSREGAEVQIDARVRDNAGVSLGNTTLHLLTPGGGLELLLPRRVNYDPFSGWIYLKFTPTSLSGGTYRAYLQVEDVSGNVARVPTEGWETITITGDVSVVLDLARSDMRAYTLLNASLHTSFQNVTHVDGTLEEEELGAGDVYLVIDPKKGYTPAEVEALRSFLGAGGKVMALLSPEKPEESGPAENLSHLTGIQVSAGEVWKALQWNTTFPPFSSLETTEVSGTMRVEGGDVVAWGDGKPAGAVTEGGVVLPASPFRDAFYPFTEDALLSTLFYLSGPQPLKVAVSLTGGTWLEGGRYHVVPGETLGVEITAHPEPGEGATYRVLWGDGSESVSSAPRLNHTYKSSGNVTLHITVSSPSGAGAAEVSLLVDHPPQIEITVEPPSPRSWEWIYFNATYSDRDGRVVSVRWDFGDGYTAEGRSAVHYYRRHGTYVVRVWAVDDVGVRTERVLYLDIANTPPEGGIAGVAYVSSTPVTITGGLLKVREGDAVLLEAWGEDKDGDVLEYLWRMDGDEWRGKYFREQFNTSGIYDVELEVLDSSGLTARDSLRIVVENVPPRAEIIYSGDGKKYTFRLGGQPDTGEDLQNLRVRWYFGDGTSGEGMRVEHTYRFGGRYRVRVEVEDPEGEKDVDYAAVHVPGWTLWEVLAGAICVSALILLVVLYVYKRRGEGLKGSSNIPYRAAVN